MENTNLTKENEEELLSQFSKKMIHLLTKYKPPKLFAGCYIELDLVQGKFFGEKTIGQLVGKSGERKEEFFSLTGIKPHIEDSRENPLLILSKYNVREIKLASLLGQRFKTSKSWSSSSIHKHFQQLQRKLTEEEDELGSKVLQQFEPESLPNSIKNAVGRMNNEYYSETQTLLDHSREVAEESAKAATALTLDVQKAWRLAFYHDIGKVFLPYHLHDSQEVFQCFPDLTDSEIRDCIEKHHTSPFNIESPYIALVSILNKLVSQSHFLRGYSINKNVDQLKLSIKSAIDNFLQQENSFKFYSYLSTQVLWIIINENESNLLTSEKWECIVNDLKTCVNNQIKIGGAAQLDDEFSRFNISIYCLPKLDKKASITKLRFNLTKDKISI